jgi:spore coat protein U-like protein
VKYIHVKSAMAAAAVLAFALVSAPKSFASTTTSSIAVSATVVNNCTVSANPLAFGQYSGAALNVSTTISVTCNSGDGYSVGLSAGTGSGASVTNRLMTLSGGSATQTLAYSLLSGSYTGTNWGNASGSWVTGTGNGAAQTLTVYGVVAAGLYPTAGSYGDAVTVTLTY